MRFAAGLTLNEGQCISKLISINTTLSLVVNDMTEQQYECKYCSKTFTSEGELQQHESQCKDHNQGGHTTDEGKWEDEGGGTK